MATTENKTTPPKTAAEAVTAGVANPVVNGGAVAPIVNPVAPAATEPVATPGMVLMPQEVVQALIDKVETLTQNVKEIEQTASQDQIRKIEALRASGKLVKSVKVNMYDGEVVTSWKSTADDVYVDHNGKEQSRQMTEITLASGKKIELPQLDFARRKTHKELEVIKEAKTDWGFELTMLDTDGREITLNANFIN